MIKANQMMVSKYGAEVSGESVSGRVIIKTGLHLLANTRIKGPAYIGEGVKIGRNSVIEASAIYDGTVIGEGVQVRNSILMDNVRVLDRTTVSGSVIMRNTTIGGEECEISDSVLAPAPEPPEQVKDLQRIALIGSRGRGKQRLVLWPVLS